MGGGAEGAERYNGGVPRAAEEREKKKRVKKSERREGEMYK